MRKLLRSLKPYMLLLAISIVLAIISSLLLVFGPKILGDMTTIATSSFLETGAVAWGKISEKIVILITIYIISAVLSYFENYLINFLTAKYTKDLRAKIIQKISRLPIIYFDKNNFGDVLSRMNNDVDILASSLSQQIIEIVTSLVTVIGILVMMLTISVPLSLITLTAVLLSFILISKTAKKAQKLFHAERITLGKLNSQIEEDYSGQSIIKSNSHETASIEKFQKTNETLFEQSWKSQFLSSLAFPVTHIFTNLGYILICIFGGQFVITGKLLIGNLQSFIQYVGQFNRPITNVAEITAVIQRTLAASERIFNFLEETEEIPDAKDSFRIENLKGSVEFRNVNFSYDGETETIKNFSIKIDPGKKVAIVGPTGAGKTTLINLLMRFYDPDSGEILIDDLPTKNMKRSDVRKLFGMVLQDTWLFSGTIEENLLYSNRNADKDAVRHAAKIANIDHYIESLPNGYKTQISENSDNISAGEKQLLTIARALVANPPMLILDEATSNVDTRTEQLIQDAFEKITKNRTSFVIAHRLSTVRNADLILVIKNGEIVEKGTHESLLAANGFYTELYNSQFRKK